MTETTHPGTVLELQGISKSFNGSMVLEDVSFSVRQRQVIGIIGRSGSGKSTLLRCINGLEEVEAGRILFEGEDITEKGTDMVKIRRRIGMVFQHFALFPHMTVAANVMEGPCTVLKIPKDTARDLALELLRKVDMHQHANILPSKLSGGQQQRVAIARALAMSPHLMLYDEPTSALDPELTSEVLSVIMNLGDIGVATIIVTHEMGFIRRIADIVHFLDNGRIVESGHPSDIFQTPSESRTKAFISHYDWSTREK